MPIYDECEDGYLDNAPKGLVVCNNRLDHHEEGEGPKWDVSSCFSNSDFSCLEECISLDFLKEKDVISAEVHKENQAITLEILKGIVDAPFVKFHEHCFQGSCEKKCDIM